MSGPHFDSSSLSRQHQSEAIVEEILGMFSAKGDSMYGGEGVTQLEHGLQAAAMAESEGASDFQIVAALLHDIGHLLHDLPDDAPDNDIDDQHEALAAAWLKDRFPPDVVDPVRLHVASKRYLCAVEEMYWESLSEPSQISLRLQGGKMSEDECEEFRAEPHFESAVRLRRWDDWAKVIGKETPAIEHYSDHIRRTCLAAGLVTDAEKSRSPKSSRELHSN